MGILKAMLIAISIACLAICIMTAGVSARIEARWALQAGNVIAGEDISIEHPMASLFHQQTATASDLEDTNISFPNDLNLNSQDSPVQGVDLALPSISQNVNQSIDESSTGFFKANWAYVADVSATNCGASPLGLSFAPQNPFNGNGMVGSGLLWPLMIPQPMPQNSLAFGIRGM